MQFSFFCPQVVPPTAACSQQRVAVLERKALPVNRRRQTFTMGLSLKQFFVYGSLLCVLIAHAVAPVLKVAVGYPALLACAGIFVQQRSIEDLQASDFAYRPELKLVSFNIDKSARTVTANFLGGYLATQVAKYVLHRHTLQ
jgi:hypothetical protein